MRPGGIIKAMFGVALSAGCMQGPAFMSQGEPAPLRRGGVTAPVTPTVLVPVVEEAQDVFAATVSRGADVIQKVEVPEGSELAGFAASIPPGALAIDTTVSLEPGTSLASLATLAALGAGGADQAVLAQGATAIIEPAKPTDLAAPMTVALALPTGAALALQSDSLAALVVSYRVMVAADGSVLEGIVPRAQIKVVGDKLTFETRFFGAFQALLLAKPATAAREVKSAGAILTRRDAALLPTPTIAVEAGGVQDRAARLQIRVTGLESVARCLVQSDRDGVAPIDAVILDALPEAPVLAPALSDAAHEIVARAECADVNGRSTGLSAWSAPVAIAAKAPSDVTPPTVPTGLVTAADQATGADVRFDDDEAGIFFRWSAATDAQSGIRDYTVHWYGSAGCSGSATTVAGIKTTHYALAPVVHGRTYSFQVVAHDGVGLASERSACSGALTIDATPPSAPTALVTAADAANGPDVRYDVDLDGFWLAWSPSLDPDTDVASYTVSLHATPGCTGAATTIPGIQTTSHRVSTVASGATYSFRVQAVNKAGGVSAPSACSGAITIDPVAPAAPTALVTAADSATGADVRFDDDTTVFLIWAAASDGGGSGIRDYTVHLYAQAGCAGIATLTSGVTATHLEATGLAAGTTYSFRAQAFDRAGNAGTASACSGAITIDLTAPTAPTGLVLSADVPTKTAAAYDDDASIYVNWDAPGDVDLAAYEVRGYGNSSCAGIPARTVPDADPAAGYAVVGSLPDGTHSFTVTARDLAGNTATSSCVGPIVVDTVPPTPPGSLLVRSGSTAGPSATTWDGAASMFLTFGAASDLLSGLDRTELRYYRDGSCSTFTSATPMAPTATSSPLATGDLGNTAGLLPVVSWKVRAFDNAGNSADSSCISLTFGAGPPVITSVTSTTPNGVYGVGAPITIGVVVDRPVTVTGTPYLSLNTGSNATYSGGSGTTTLTFQYIVQHGDETPDLDVMGSASFHLNGATVVDAGSNPLVLTLPTPGAAGSLSAAKAIVIDTTPPVALTGLDAALLANGGIELTWTHAGVVSDRYLLVRKAGSPVTGGPLSGSSYAVGNTVGSATVIYAGDAKVFQDTSVSVGVTYHYAVYAYDEAVNYTSGAASGPVTPQAAPSAIVDVVSGPTAEHTCVLRADGSVQCWGVNASGQLGLGHNVPKGAATSEMGANLPAVDLGGQAAIKVVVNSSNSCALTASGALSCWGDNSMGQLGIGTFGGVKGVHPNDMGVGLLSVQTLTNVQWGAFGFDHACAIDNADVYCWGANGAAQIGDGTTTASPTPVFVGIQAQDLAIGTYHSCALNEGNVYCWGFDSEGQLGDGTHDDVTPAPELVTGISTVDRIVSGARHMCALTGDGSLHCWGANGSGQVGNDTTGAVYQPTYIMANVQDVALGDNHTCAIAAGGVYCWGSNAFGQLGLGTIAQTSSPNTAVDLGTGFTPVKITAGKEHTCALSSAGVVKCWGRNTSGQLGIGAPGDRGDQAGEMGDQLPAVLL